MPETPLSPFEKRADGGFLLRPVHTTASGFVGSLTQEFRQWDETPVLRPDLLPAFFHQALERKLRGRLGFQTALVASTLHAYDPFLGLASREEVPAAREYHLLLDEHLVARHRAQKNAWSRILHDFLTTRVRPAFVVLADPAGSGEQALSFQGWRTAAGTGEMRIQAHALLPERRSVRLSLDQVDWEATFGFSIDRLEQAFARTLATTHPLLRERVDAWMRFMPVNATLVRIEALRHPTRIDPDD